MPRLSIVIPSVADCNLLEDSLVSVLENRPADCEILVVHNRPYDDPYALAGEVRFLRANSTAGLAECLDIGAAAARPRHPHVGLRRGGFCGLGQRGLAAFPRAGHRRAGRGDLVPRQSAETGFGGRRLPDRGCGRPAGGRQRRCEHHRRAGRVWHSKRRGRVLSQVGVGGGWRIRRWTDAELTSADTGLRLEQLGFRCAVDRQCLAKADPAVLRRTAAFRLGRESERLFWRWATAHGRWRSLAGHAALAIGECVIGPWRPSLFARLAGRVCGAVGVALHSTRPTPVQGVPSGSPQVLTTRDSAPAADCRAKGRKAKAA